MAPWVLHELYPFLDIENILGYPNKPPPKYDKKLPKFDGDPLAVVPHVLAFMRHISKFEERHEDAMIRLFLLSLE